MTYIYNLLPSLIEGLKVTLEIFLITLGLSFPLGIIISLFRISKVKFLKYISSFFIYIMRGTPLLLQLIVIFFGLPLIGITLDRFLAAAIAFTLNYSAYFGEIFRGGIEDIDKGQYEACEVLGFSKIHTLKRIIIPQMIKKVLPSITNEVITLVKDTSLVYVLGIGELLRAGKIASNKDVSLIPLLIVAFLYLLIIGILSKLFKLLEKNYNYY